MNGLAQLPHVWRGEDLAGYRSTGKEYSMYEPFDLGSQPMFEPDPQLQWLDSQSDKGDWALSEGHSEPSRKLDMKELDALGCVDVPESLRLLARRPELQRRIRSATGCYLDLGDSLVRTSDPDCVLVHILSDSQWVRHWLLVLSESGEQVVTTRHPFGFDLTPDDAEFFGMPEQQPFDLSLDFEICAFSFAEFLYRFWVENELWWAIHDGVDLRGEIADYAAQLVNPTQRP